MKEIERHGDEILLAAETAEEIEYFGDKVYSKNVNQVREPWFIKNFRAWQSEKLERLRHERHESQMIASHMRSDLHPEIAKLYAWCQIHAQDGVRLTRANSPIQISEDLIPEWNKHQTIRPGKLIQLINKTTK